MSSSAPAARFAWRYYVGWSGPGDPHADSGDQLTLTVSCTARPGERLLLDWKAQCWERLREAAQARYALRQQQLTALRDSLREALTREDSLMLRKLEKEELMKAALRWILGPGFEFYPSSLLPLAMPDGDAEAAIASDLEYYAGTGSSQAVVPETYESMLQHGELVEFLNQAIEWENVNYVLYPYFWTDDTRWDFKQSLFHPEYVHRLFLRAGAARVVLPIRPGWEKRFVAFAETLRIDGVLPDEAGHPYMTIASEVEAMARTTYAYTESPNKECEANLVKHWFEFTPTGALDVVAGAVLLEDEDLEA
jgi:hypothetical protein